MDYKLIYEWIISFLWMNKIPLAILNKVNNFVDKDNFMDCSIKYFSNE